MSNLIEMFQRQLGNTEAQARAVEDRDRFRVESTMRRQAVQDGAVKASRKIASESRASSQRSREAQLGILSTEEETVRVAQEAIRLSDSQNPLDKVQLWFLQQSDPRYTREGNLERIRYLRTARESLAQRGALEQEGYIQALDQVEADVAMALRDDNAVAELLDLDVEVGANRIAAAQEIVKAQSNLLAEQATMRQEVLESLPREALQERIDSAVAQGLGKIIGDGGVQIPLEEASERLRVLNERAANRAIAADAAQKVRLSELPDTTLREMQLAAQDGFAKFEDGTPVSQYLVQEVLANRAANSAGYQLAVDQQRVALEDMKRREIAQMGLSDVNTALQANGEFEGVQYDIGQLQARAADLAQQATTQGELIRQQAVAVAPEAAIGSGVEYFDRILSAGNLSPQLAEALQQQRSVLLSATGLIPEGMDVAQKAQIAQGLVREAIMAADTVISAEALRLANGDETLAQVHEARMRGQAAPLEAVTEVLSQSLKEQGTVAAWLPAGLATEFMNTYSSSLMALGQQGVFLEDDAKEAMAFNEAMRVLTARAMESYNPTIMGFQVAENLEVLNHPLRGQVSPEQLISLFAQADQKGLESFKVETGLDPARDELTDADQYRLSVTQMAEFLMLLEEERLGAAKAMVEWWNSKDRLNFGGLVGQGIAQQAAGNPQQHVLASVVNTQLPELLPAMNRALQDGFRVVNEGMLAERRALFMNFSGDQQRRQMYMLQQDETLADGEKRIILQQILNPILQGLESEGYKERPVAEQARLIEERLQGFQTDVVALKRLHSKLMRNRSRIVTDLENFTALAISADTGTAPAEFSWSQ